MHPSESKPDTKIRGTKILATDTPQQYREKLARIAMDEMYQFVAVLDAQGTLLEVNRAALEGAGLKLADVEGKPFWECFWWAVSTEIQEELKKAILRASAGEFVRYDVEVYGRAHGKETIIIDFSMIPVTDETGNVVFIVPEGRDITEKKAQEREIAQKNADLQALLERIRELDEIKTQFFANVSHELRTPLALIIGPAQRLIDESSGVSPDERREAASVIARNARILLKHVNDLLDLSKLEAGKLKIELEDANLGALIRLIASHFDVLAQERTIDYELEVPDGVVCAIDAEKLERVLMNLVSNAFKFVPDRGRIRCALQVTGQEVVIAVDDSGPGVKPELRRLIFERFRQGQGGANRRFGGTGLGLAIAKEFVEMHRGTLEVLDSSLGGARFELRLPNHRVHPDRTIHADPTLDTSLITGIIEELRPGAAARPELEANAHATGRPTVLVVEDNPEMNRFICQALRGEYEVSSAFNGQEGLERALAVRPSLILSDIMMPVMSGVEMIAEIRKRPEFRETPIIVLSAKADEELKLQLLEEGTQDFITKPFDEKELLVRVRNSIGIRQSQERERQETEIAAALYRVAASFAYELDQQKLVQLVTDEATTLTGAEFGSFFFNVTREDGGAYLLYTLSGAAPEAFAGFPMPRATPLFGPTFRGEGTIRLDDVRKDPRYGRLGKQPKGHLPVVSYLAVPVIGTGGEVLGGLFFGHGQPGRFTQVHERIVIGLAAQAAAALEKARLYQALRDSETRAREADRRKDEFLAMLGHELRNPLAPIMTALQLMDLRGETGSTKERQVIDRQVHHLAGLVDDLLDIARVTRGKIQIKKQTVNLASVVEKAVEMASPLFEHRRHRLRLDVPRSGLMVDADPDRIAQVVANLLTNAAKYTEPGGSVVLTARVKEDWIVVSVKDTGQGIAPDLLPQIFDLFVQGRRTSERAQGGLGIGLALVKNLVELHGGRVEARSEGPGRGSEFSIELPAVQGTSAVSPDTRRGLVTKRPRLESRILVVDDNVDAASMLAEGLSLLGHEVVVAHDGPQALARARSFRATTALLDIGLPVMDGYELARRLREVWTQNPVRYVAITGYGQEADKEKAKAVGFDSHLVKPVSLAELADLLKARDA